MTKLYEYTATGRYYKVYVDGEYISQHSDEREAIEAANVQKFIHYDSDVYYIHEYEVDVALTDAGITEAQEYEAQVDQPPTINSTPSPSFTEGVADTYDMTQHVSDDGLSAVTYSLSNTLPNGLSFNGSTGILTYDGVASASVSSHALTATDAVGNDTSASFNIDIVDASAFTPQSGFTLSGTVVAGNSTTLTDSSSRFGTKNTQAPHLYDLIDLGTWVDGSLVTSPYTGLNAGDDVPVQAASDPNAIYWNKIGAVMKDDGPSVGHDLWFGGNNGANDALVTTSTGSVFEPANSFDRQHYVSWQWRSDFSPGTSGKGTSSKFLRVWDTSSGPSDTFQLSWTRMHLTESHFVPYPSSPNTDITTDEWVHFEYEMNYDTVANGGFLNARAENNLIHGNFTTLYDAGWNGSMFVKLFGWDPSSSTNVTGTEDINFSDFYIDNSLARIVITDNATYASSVMKVPQMHTSWAAGEIIIEYLYAGPLLTLAGNHLHVVKEDLTTIYIGQFN